MVEDNKNKDREWWVKFISVTFVILSVIVLFILKRRNPDMDLSLAIYIIVSVAIFGLVAIFQKKIGKIIKNTDTIEKVMTKQDITNKIIDYAHNNRHNNLAVTNPITLFKTDTIGNDIIYAIRVRLNLDNEEFIMIINASFEGREPVYLEADAKTEEIESEMNKIARSPKLNSVNETISENQLTGTKVITRTTIPLDEDKKENNSVI